MFRNFFTVKDAAERLDVTTAAIYNWLRDGKIPGYRVGRNWRIDPDDLNRFIALGRNVNHSKYALSNLFAHSEAGMFEADNTDGK